MTASARLDADQVRLVEEAAEWRLIGLLFEYPGEGWRDRLAAVGASVREPRLRAAAEAAQQEATEGWHHALFGPGGPISLREVTYQGGVQFGQLLAELQAYYDAFAYQPRTTEAADNLSVEIGFLSYLALKQAYALVSRQPEQAGITAEAADRFRADHVARMAKPIATALAAAGAPEYLEVAGKILFERVGPPPFLPLTPAPLPEDDELRCS